MNIMKRNCDYAPSYINLFDDFFEKNYSNLFLDNRSMRTLPSVNIANHDKEFTVELAAPGYEKEDFKVNVENGVLTIKAEVNKETEEKKNYSHREYYYSSFERSFTLPDNVDENEIKATYKHGVLHVQLPKMETAPVQPIKEIKIQ